jgi:hypothetical protein
MGAYDELVLTITFKEDTPMEVIDTLRYMLDLAEVPVGENDPPHPKHPYFEMEAWNELFTLDYTAYFSGEQVYKLSQDEFRPNVYHFTCRAIMKSGGDHIIVFVHWLLPYSDREGFHGYTRNDELPDYCDHIYIENGEVYLYQIHISNKNPPDVTHYKISENGRLLKIDN